MRFIGAILNQAVGVPQEASGNIFKYRGIVINAVTTETQPPAITPIQNFLLSFLSVKAGTLGGSFSARNF